MNKKKKRNDFLDCPYCSKAIISVDMHGRYHETNSIDGTDITDTENLETEHPDKINCGNCGLDITLFMAQYFYKVSKRNLAVLKYLDSPDHCPKCGSLQIEGQEVVIEDVFAIQEMGCNDCDSSWENVHRLEYIRNFKKGEVKK